MRLHSLMETFDCRVTGGSEYQWHCYGSSARFMDFESEYAHASAIFDAETQQVYEVTVNAKDDDVGKTAYRWIDPDFKLVHDEECHERGVDTKNAWDNVNWIDIETEDDFLEKAGGVFNNVSYDTRIVVPLDLEDDVILQLALEAHKRDITINQMVEIILQNAIDQHKRVNDK